MPDKIPARELGNVAMIDGNEKKYRKVIDRGILKQWVGFGWIDLHEATRADMEKYPTVSYDHN